MFKYLLTAGLLLSSQFIFSQFEICNSNTDQSLNDVHFISDQVGIVVGDSGAILRSTDGGFNWSETANLDSRYFYRVKFWNNQRGIVIGDHIFTTEDAGQTWSKLAIDAQGFLDIELIGNNAAIVSSEFGEVYKITNFGEEASLLFSNTAGLFFNHLSFIDESIGFGHYQDGSLSRMYKTTDGGLNWSEVEYLSGERFTIVEDLKFLSESVGFKGGWYSPHLAKTDDGGRNWNQTELAYNEWEFWSSIYDFHIEPDRSSIFYSCGWYGEIFRSVDAGFNWAKLESPVSSPISLKGIFFIDDSVGWVVGDYGTILKTTNGGGWTFTQEIAHQNLRLYPNPVENNLHIAGLNATEVESIVLFDLSGKQQYAFRSVNEISLAGLPTGIYFIEIETPRGTFFSRVVKN